MSYPKVRKEIAQGLAEKIKQEFPEVRSDCWNGNCRNPHAAWVAEILDFTNGLYSQQSESSWQRKPNRRTDLRRTKMVVIEDLISTGGSVLEAAEAAKREGADVFRCHAYLYLRVAKRKS